MREILFRAKRKNWRNLSKEEWWVFERVDKVTGWHYSVIPTDELSKCEPFCLPMPLTEEYIKLCEMAVCGNIFDNSELLGGKNEQMA